MRRYLYIVFILIFLFVCIFVFRYYQEQISKTTLYKISPENMDVINKFYDAYKQNIITTEDYNNLIKNLDKESVETVKLILERIVTIRESNDKNYKYIALYKNKELSIIKRFVKDYAPSRYMGLTYVNKYIFPIDIISAHVLFSDCGVPYIKNKTKIKKKDIIDAGAYVGDSSIVLSKYTLGKVYAFEPVSDTYNLLQKTISLNKNTDNIVPVKKALSSKTGKKYISISDGLLNAKTTNDIDKNKDYEVVDTITVDEFVEKNNLKIGLIKTDVEGDEQALLNGAQKTIKEQKPVLIISIYHSPDDFFHIKTLIESWNLGYKFKIIRTSPVNIICETVLIAEVY